jgi:uncharacterized membrane protein
MTTKLFHALVADVLDHLQTPEAQKLLETKILRPVISTVLHIVYPYLLGVMVLWIIMFVCVALILLILVRGSLLQGIGRIE